MAWNDKLPTKPKRDIEPWTNNPQIWAEYDLHIGKRGAKNTQRNHRTYAGVFVRSFEDPVHLLDTPDIEAWVERIGTKCSKLMNGAEPQCLKMMDVKACPVLHGIQPYTTCPAYEPLLPSGVWSYVCAINSLYDWMLVQGRIGKNPALPVMRDFLSRNKDWFDERRRKPHRRVLSTEDIRTLVLGSPIHHGIGVMTMAKCFLRIHEVLKLSWHPDFCNLDEGWMDIPRNWDLGGKRKGNQRIIIDHELKPWMRRYRTWWEDHVKRDKDTKEPLTDAFLITIFGMLWGTGAIHNYNVAIQDTATNQKLMDGTETERRQRVNSHGARAYATTYAKDRKITAMDLQTLRGDLSPGSILAYDDYLQRLPELYRQYAPVLGL